MSEIQNDALLVGLAYLEAVMKGDDEMRTLVESTYSKDEIIKSLTAVSLAMTTVVAHHKGSDFSALEVINTARLAVFGV